MKKPTRKSDKRQKRAPRLTTKKSLGIVAEFRLGSRDVVVFKDFDAQAAITDNHVFMEDQGSEKANVAYAKDSIAWAEAVQR